MAGLWSGPKTVERGGTHDFGVDSIEQMQFTPYRPILHTCLLLSERHPLAPPQPHSTCPIYSLPNPHPLLRTGTLQIRSYNQSGVCSVELLLARLMEALSPLHEIQQSPIN